MWLCRRIFHTKSQQSPSFHNTRMVTLRSFGDSETLPGFGKGCKTQTEVSIRRATKNNGMIVSTTKQVVSLSQHAGIIIPPLPEKSTMQKFQMTSDFIEQRRRALQVFVNRVVSNLAPHELDQCICLFSCFLIRNAGSAHIQDTFGTVTLCR